MSILSVVWSRQIFHQQFGQNRSTNRNLSNQAEHHLSVLLTTLVFANRTFSLFPLLALRLVPTGKHAHLLYLPTLSGSRKVY